MFNRLTSLGGGLFDDFRSTATQDRGARGVSTGQADRPGWVFSRAASAPGNFRSGWQSIAAFPYTDGSVLKPGRACV